MISMEENIRPPISPDEARAIAQTYYNFEPTAVRALPSELDRNYQLQNASGERYLLKIAHRSVSDSVLDLQNKTLKHLRKTMDIFPQIIPAASGEDTIRIHAEDGGGYRARLLRYIEGLPLSDFRPHSDALLADIGRQLGKLSAAMQGFSHQEKRLHYRWNIGNLSQVARYGDDLPQAKKSLLETFLRLYEDEVAPALPQLRHSFSYNDPNDSNILVRAQGPAMPQVAGMIDFGDMVYGPTMADLAVALAYIMMGSENPLDKATSVVRAYHGAFPLREEELRLLFPLIGARLCLSLCISWHQQKREPDNRHLSISESGAWELLEQLRAINPNYAHYHFRSACGLPACPQTAALIDWLDAQSLEPILGKPLTAYNSKIVDCGMTSRLLAQVKDLADPATYSEPLRRRLGENTIGIGLYDEVRPIYLADMFAIDHHQRRAVHLGADLFAPPETAIYAPLAGTIHSLADCADEQDYGPVLILKHEPKPDLCFYTLYGHLSPSALERWEVGDWVEAGKLLARIGDYPRNGNWTPHLHFQIVVDLLDNDDNFPGVCAPKQRAMWTSLSPDPNHILGLPYSIQPPAKSARADLIQRRRMALNPALSLSYQAPLKITRGFMRHLYDEDGQPFLDCVNNVAHVGHSHPRVVQAAHDQIALLNTNTRYLHDTLVEYAEALTETLPEPLTVCFFVNSGSEANELALRLATAYNGGADFIVIDHAYHGHTSALIDISPYKFNGPGGQGKPAHVQVAEMPDGFSGGQRGFDARAGRYYARSVAEKIASVHARERKLAAFIAEGIMGCGGQMPLPAGYLKRAYEMTREAGGLCIADEIQAGFGRVGDHFWSFELSGVVPDIVTMGKPMGNGHPLGAVVTTPEIAAAFDNGMEYFNTFGGNPVSCAIGLEVLSIIQDEDLQRKARDIGAYWIERLGDLAASFPIIGQVRGSGLFLGIELVRDPISLAPADWEATYIAERMKEHGILVSMEGPHHNALKLKPPMCFGREQVDLFVDVLAEVLEDTVLRVG
ncbi:MAG: aminotransferase class III-fold pyridoxal phosphate-dependent enzyme [Chloroflexota bacterium]|nr:aminotransferase class III-fold pyridoxal phosphate-dependent enzyme [Chloroflexota bacterium]